MSLKRILSTLIIISMLITFVPNIADTVHAGNTTVSELSGSTAGTSLAAGYIYKVTKNISYNTNRTSFNGIEIPANSTVVIYIAPNCSLYTYGKNGSGVSGGGAGLCVPNTSTLVITGGGNLYAYGGNSGSPTNGADAGAATTSGDIGSNYDGYTFIMGKGGAGGNGAGSAGTGIGGGGATGGIGGREVTKSERTYITSVSGTAGNSGGDGGSGASMGVVYMGGTVKVYPYKGATSTTSGSAGKAEKRSEALWHSNWRGWKGVGSGGSGGGGGISSDSANIGGSGAAGGGGGSGSTGSTFYRESSVYRILVGSGGGGGGGYGFGGSSITDYNAWEGWNQISGALTVSKGSNAARANADSGSLGGSNSNTFSSLYSGTIGIASGGKGGNKGNGGAGGAVYKHSEATLGTIGGNSAANHYGKGATLYSTTTLPTVARYLVTFNHNGGTYDNSAATNAYSYYGVPLSNSIIPVRAGYTFAGYYSTTAVSGGTQYFNKDGVALANTNYTDSLKAWIKAGDATVYARWTPLNYSLTLDKQGGADGSGNLTVTMGSVPTNISIPSRTGYDFGGYFSARNGEGSQVYSASGVALANANGYTNSSRQWINTDSSTILYAKWIPKTYNVTLNATGAVPQIQPATVDYLGTFQSSVIVPLKAGYVFEGYYTGTGSTGTKYFGSDGSPTDAIWTSTSTSPVLYAGFRESIYSETLDNGGYELPRLTNWNNSVNHGEDGILWETTASDEKIELTRPLLNRLNSISSFNTLFSPEGQQFAELNSVSVGGQYQILSTYPGETYNWGLSHKGRYGEDTLQAWIGTTEDVSEALRQYKANDYDITKVNESLLNKIQLIPNSNDDYPNMKSGNDQWTQYSGTYTMPTSQVESMFALVGVSSSGGDLSSGNLIDDVYFQQDEHLQSYTVQVNPSKGGTITASIDDQLVDSTDNNNKIYSSVKEGSEISFTETEDMDYTFFGALVNGKFVKHDDLNMTLTAGVDFDKFTEITFLFFKKGTITFNTGEGSYSPEGQPLDEYTLDPKEKKSYTIKEPVLAGYDFTGWEIVGGENDSPQLINNDRVDYEVRTEDDSNPDNPLAILTTYRDDEEIYNTDVDNGMVLMAQYEPKVIHPFTVNYDFDGGKMSGQSQVSKVLNSANTSISLGTPVKTGYEFKGWKFEGDDTIYDSDSTVNYKVDNYIGYYNIDNGSWLATSDSNKSITVIAQWEELEYGYELDYSGEFAFDSVTYGYVDTTPKSISVDVMNTGQMNTDELTATISGAGFSFANNLDETTVDDIGVGQSSENAFTVKPISGLNPGKYSATITLKSQYKPDYIQSFKVSMIVNKLSQDLPTYLSAQHSHVGDNDGKIVGLDSSLTYEWKLLTAPDDAWADVSGKIEMTDMSPGSYQIRIKADSLHDASPYININIKEYANVILDTLGGSISSGEELTKYFVGEGATLPEPTKDGKIFDGWYENTGYDGNPVTEITALDNDDKEFYAKWVDKTYELELSPSAIHQFEERTYGYSTTPDALSVELHNVGNQPFNSTTISMSGDSDSFVVSPESTGAVNPDGKVAISVSAKSGLDAGNHKATITVIGTAEGGITTSASISVQFQVNKANQVTPSGIKSNVDSGGSTGNGKIIDLNPQLKYEYKLVSDNNYTSAASGSEVINGLKAGTYHVRICESTNYKASNPCKIVVSKYYQIEDYTFDINPSDDNYLTMSITEPEDEYTYYLIDHEDMSIVKVDSSFGQADFANILPNHEYSLIATPINGAPEISDTAPILNAEGNKFTAPDTSYFIVPQLSDGNATRPRMSHSTVTFKSNVDVGYYEYAIVNRDETPTVYSKGDNLKKNNSFELSNLNADSKIMYIRPVSQSGTRGEPIKVDIPNSYGISLGQSDNRNFGIVSIGYSEIKPHKVVITNISTIASGDITMSLGKKGTSAFDLNKTTISALEAGDAATFTVVPKSYLGVGEYHDTVYVQTDEGMEATFEVEFTVRKKAAINTAKNYQTQISYAGKSINVSELFNIVSDGTPTYDITFGTGEGKLMGDILNVEKAGTFIISLKTDESESYRESDTFSCELTVNKGNQGLPTNWKVISQPSSSDPTGGAIEFDVGTGTLMEYRIKTLGRSSFIPVEADTLTGLGEEDYEIRYKENDLYNAGLIQTVNCSMSSDRSNINFVLDGGVLSYDISEYIEGVNTVLPQAVKEGSVFMGWYTDPDYNGAPIDIISSSISGDLELYAKFKPLDYRLTLDDVKNGIIGLSTSLSNYLDEVSLTASAISGYELANESMFHYATGKSNFEKFPINEHNGVGSFTMPSHDTTVTGKFVKTYAREKAEKAFELIKKGNFDLMSADANSEKEIKEILAKKINTMLSDNAFNFLINPDDITINNFVKAKDTIPAANGSYDFSVDFGSEDVGNLDTYKIDNKITAENIINNKRKIDVKVPKFKDKPSYKPELSRPLGDFSNVQSVRWEPKVKDGETFKSGISYKVKITLTAKENARFDNTFVPIVPNGTVKNITFTEDYLSSSFDVVFPITKTNLNNNEDDNVNKINAKTADSSNIGVLLILVLISLIIELFVSKLILTRKPNHVTEQNSDVDIDEIYYL